MDMNLALSIGLICTLGVMLPLLVLLILLLKRQLDNRNKGLTNYMASLPPSTALKLKVVNTQDLYEIKIQTL